MQCVGFSLFRITPDNFPADKKDYHHFPQAVQTESTTWDLAWNVQWNPALRPPRYYGNFIL